MTRPDPTAELRITTLHALRGANFWSRGPVTRMDVLVGAYENISSADVPGTADAIAAALPGLIEHRCSIGERGGFLTRLHRGTYAPHIIEHVALELQSMAGHEVGYGRARGGDQPGEYTIVVEHAHSEVGLRAAALAVDVVQRAFAGTLDRDVVAHAVRELEALSRTPDIPPRRQTVRCGITGGGPRHETREELLRRGIGDDQLVVEVAPSFLLQQGLPYSRSETAIVLDARPTDVPDRYRDPERARRLVSVIADGVANGGVVIAPAKEWEVQDYARDRGCRVAIFATDDDVTARDEKVAGAVAMVRDGRIRLESHASSRDGGPLRDNVPADAQVAAALTAFLLGGQPSDLTAVTCATD